MINKNDGWILFDQNVRTFRRNGDISSMLGETSALQVYRVERASLAEGVRGGGRVGGGYHMWRWHGLEAAAAKVAHHHLHHIATLPLCCHTPLMPGLPTHHSAFSQRLPKNQRGSIDTMIVIKWVQWLYTCQWMYSTSLKKTSCIYEPHAFQAKWVLGIVGCLPFLIAALIDSCSLVHKVPIGEEWQDDRTVTRRDSGTPCQLQ